MAERRVEKDMKNYEMWYDEKLGVLRFKVINPLTAEDAREITPLAEKLMESKDTRAMLVDLTAGSSMGLSKEVRAAFREGPGPFKYEKIALYGANPVERMIAKAILAVSGSKQIARFFKNEEEALSWIKEEKKKQGDK